MKRYILSSLAIVAVAGVLSIPVDAITYCWRKVKGALA